MVLLFGLRFGTNKAFEHSKIAGSSPAVCYFEGVQAQCRNANRKLYNEVPRGK